MTTLKTPSPQQWRKLCEMAGFPFECETPYGPAYRFSDGEQAQVMSVGLLSHNTDTLMRLMDAVFPTRLIASEPSGSVITAMDSHARKYECEVEHIDGVEEVRLAACDILAQLAVAEGWE